MHIKLSAEYIRKANFHLQKHSCSQDATESRFQRIKLVSGRVIQKLAKEEFIIGSILRVSYRWSDEPFGALARFFVSIFKINNIKSYNQNPLY